MADSRDKAQGPRLRRRADIQGLRAVAILAVVAYHAGLPVPGGYVGVDVFFVISGYLITQLLWDELSAGGRLSFAGFYARRARRLLPSAVLVIVVTCRGLRRRARSPRGDGGRQGRRGVRPLRRQLSIRLPGDELPERARAGLAAAELLVARRRGAVLPGLAGVAPRGASSSAVAPRPPPAAVGGLGSLGRDRRPGGHRGPLLLDVRLPDALEPALGVLLAPDAGVGTGAWAAPVALAVPHARRVPALGAVDDRLGRPRRRGVVARRLRPTDASSRVRPRSSRWQAPERRWSPDTRQLTAGPAHLLGLGPLQPIGAVSYTWYLWHWPTLVLAPYVLGHRLGLAEQRGRLPVQPGSCGSDHRPPRAAGPALTVALGSHRAQPRDRRRAQPRRRAGGCGGRGGSCRRRWAAVTSPPHDWSPRIPPQLGRRPRLRRPWQRPIRSTSRSTGRSTSRSPTQTCQQTSHRRSPTRRPTPPYLSRRLLRRLHRDVREHLPVRGHDLLAHHRALRRLARPPVVPGHRQPGQPAARRPRRHGQGDLPAHRHHHLQSGPRTHLHRVQRVASRRTPAHDDAAPRRRDPRLLPRVRHRQTTTWSSTVRRGCPGCPR